MSNKFKDYANSKTSIHSRTKESARSPKISFKPIKDMGSDLANDLKDAGNSFVDDIKRGYGLNTPEDQAQEYMNKVLNKVVDPNNPVDARSTSAYFEKVNVSLSNSRYIALVEQLSMINALPPIPDNIVDPPPIWEQSLLKTDVSSWGGNKLVGKDYLQRVIARGQFLTLVPLDIIPKLIGNFGENAKNMAKKLDFVGLLNDAGEITLDKLNTRLNVASYGLTAKVNSLKYYKAVNAHMKTALLSLGIDYDLDANKNSAEIANLYKYLPDEIVQRLIGNASPVIQSIQKRFMSPNNNQSDIDDTSVDKANLTSAWKQQLQKEDNDAAKATGFISANTTGEDFIRKANYINLLQYITNIDEGDEVIKTLPFACFYCNGPIEKGMSTSSNMGESAVSSMTTDIGAKGWKNLTKDTKLISDVAGGSEEYIKEMAYHRNLGAFLVSNTYIPNVIKSSMIDFQYTVNIRDVSVSSDRFSIVRLMWTLAQLFPFVIQTNDPGSSLIVPSAPMYCSAFSKGVMNLPRAAITNMSIKSSPEFQTTEGIPTELDITITIQPLFSQTVMPNFDKFYDGTNNPEYLASAMFNPLSSFNIIATLCGQNTILTRFQAGLFSFFIGGAIKSFFSSIADTGMVVSTAWKDWWSSSDMMRNEIYSRTRIIGI